jgi:beta-glucuronidase
MRRFVDLSGPWQLAVGSRSLGSMAVPSSYFPMGRVTLSRRVRVPRNGPGRVFLVFEGIANEGEVFVGARRVGHLVPFSRHALDITEDVDAEREVSIRVALTDIHAPFGNSRGWETYGGIIRDVFLELRGDNYFERPRVITQLHGDGATVSVAATVVRHEFSSACAPRIRLLAADGTLVHEQVLPEVSRARSEVSATFSLDRAHRWSPDDPYLYQLQWTLGDPAAPHDHLQIPLGVREIAIVGRRFFLNGKPIFLKGVCRHDMWANQGYTLTREQIRQDLEEIKALGANFVRLVHYPPHPYVLEVADQLGLLVTEEPGFWNVHLRDEHLTPAKAVALEVLTRLIERDRTHPSVLGWLLGNESWTDESYLQQAADLCRALDPSRPVGFSDLYLDQIGKKVPVKDVYRGWQPDFYDYHPYGEEGKLYAPAVAALDDKPLIFGEWSGYLVQRNEWLWERLARQFAEWANASADAPMQLAGIAYWEWADMRQYERGYPACEEGVLTEGLVTEDRQRKPEWYRMQKLFQEIDAGRVRERPYPRFERVAQWQVPEATPLPIVLTDSARQAQRLAWATYAPHGQEWLQLPDELNTGALKPIQSASAHSLLISPLSPDLDLPVRRNIAGLVLVGLGDLAAGYPVMNAWGDPAIEAVLWPSSAGQPLAAWQLCHGMHVARQNRVFRGGRIEPLATDAVTLFDWVVDPDWERQIVRAWVYLLPHPAYIDRLTMTLLDGRSVVNLAAISTIAASDA